MRSPTTSLPARLLVLRHEGVSDGFHAVHGTDEDHGRAAAHDQAQRTRVVGEFVRVVRVAQVLHAIVQHDVKQRVVPLKKKNEVLKDFIKRIKIFFVRP